MKIITAKILDSTHLELSHPVSAKAGELIHISIPDDNNESRLWKDAAKKKFLDNYAGEDAIYDEL